MDGTMAPESGTMATEEELDALAAGDSREWLALDESERRWSGCYGQDCRRALPWRRLSRVQLVEAVCHADGYVREPGVRRLRRSRNPEALPLLLVRCVDWVPQVRAIARAAVLARFAQADLAPSLPLVVVLSRRAVDRWVDEHLLQPMLRSPELLDHALATPDLRTRRMVHESALRAGLLSDERLASIAVHDHDDVVRTRLGHLLLDRGDPRFVRLLLEGGAPKVRARAVQSLGVETAWERLAESSSLVRSMAQAPVLRSGGIRPRITGKRCGRVPSRARSWPASARRARSTTSTSCGRSSPTTGPGEMGSSDDLEFVAARRGIASKAISRASAEPRRTTQV
ncbi:hypothetical protein AB0F91_06510 [Amycolatopsis sp. NPDC023774]|uniref:hypothetical protein n=1 Tax=Amycolatopsis sp. NPDC023774 TaxID=3155015 RepID=UPI0033E2FF00